MVLDGMDGRVARMTRTQSTFGEQLDSLADMVSFGVAPALVMYEWLLKDIGRIGWSAAFVYCACAALRLARFNSNLGVVDKRFFQGLPSPAAAARGGARCTVAPGAPSVPLPAPLPPRPGPATAGAVASCACCSVTALPAVAARAGCSSCAPASSVAKPRSERGAQEHRFGQVCNDQVSMHVV
jgi:hypothetical protein